MSQRVLKQIRQSIRAGEYDLTRHAVEEMADDNLSIYDVETAILTGKITKTELDDLRGSRYTIIGSAQNYTISVGVVGRFAKINMYLIITVYEVTD